MNKKSLFIILTIIILFIGAFFLYNNLAESYKEDYTSRNTTAPYITATPNPKKAPDFIMADNNGNAIMFSSFIGKPTVLNFWASWCPPCKSEMPYFEKVYADVKSDVQFIMLDMVDGNRESIETGRSYINKQGFSFPVYYDSKQNGAYVYGITSIPTTIIIDSKGNIADTFIGAVDENKLRKAIEKIINR